MNKSLARILAAALVLGLLTANAGAVTPTVSTPELADSPFLPDFPWVSPFPILPESPPELANSPFLPDFSRTAQEPVMPDSPLVPQIPRRPG